VTFLSVTGTVFPLATPVAESRVGEAGKTEEYNIMTSKWKVLTLAALMALPLLSNAQPAAHDWEVTVAGTGRAASDFKGSVNAAGTKIAGGNFGANLALGYYLNDNLEVSARQSLIYNTLGSWGGSTGAAVDYNILMDKLVPFIGANLGYAYATKGGLDSWVISPEAGIKYYLQSKAFLFGMAEYQIPMRGRDSFGNGTWVFSLGIGLDL
jgi:hypothetical protein